MKNLSKRTSHASSRKSGRDPDTINSDIAVVVTNEAYKQDLAKLVKPHRPLQTRSTLNKYEASQK